MLQRPGFFWSLAGALPFVLSKSIPSYVDAFFETVSGFTTTGSTILTEIEGLRKDSFLAFPDTLVGGMGVLVFVMVLTSLDEKNSMHLMRAEVPGPEADKLVPKARGTARILYGMYFALTAIEVVFLLAGGMNLFDAVTHAFSTAGTGGFSSYNASVAHFNSAYIDGVITVFMILFGINFNLYFFLLLKEFKSVFKNEELRAYLGIIAGATVVITCNIAGGYHSLLKAFRYAAFQVASVITTTGFVTADFNKWPELSKCVLLLVMVIGASAGSTGGGIKSIKTSDPGKKHPPGAENYDPSESSQYRKNKWEKSERRDDAGGICILYCVYTNPDRIRASDLDQ